MQPNLIIIGAQKCGSSSLHQYLDLHPDIAMSEQKELDFFVDGENWDKGFDWYEAQFAGPEKIHGESSPSYTMYPTFAGVPERIHTHLPDARLIYIVRDPIDRIVSHYLHQWYDKRQDDDLSSVLADPDNERGRHYIRTSSYYLQLSQYLEFFDISRVMVVTLEDLKADANGTLRKVFGFLGVDDSFIPPESTEVVNPTAAKVRTNKLGDLLRSDHPALRPLIKLARQVLPGSLKKRARSLGGSKQIRPELDPAVRDMLQAELKPDIDRFRALTGRSFSQWSV